MEQIKHCSMRYFNVAESLSMSRFFFNSLVVYIPNALTVILLYDTPFILFVVMKYDRNDRAMFWATIFLKKVADSNLWRRYVDRRYLISGSVQTRRIMLAFHVIESRDLTRFSSGKYC